MIPRRNGSAFCHLCDDGWHPDKGHHVLGKNHLEMNMVRLVHSRDPREFFLGPNAESRAGSVQRHVLFFISMYWLEVILKDNIIPCPEVMAQLGLPNRSEPTRIEIFRAKSLLSFP
jgi:hypothetical protein